MHVEWAVMRWKMNDLFREERAALGSGGPNRGNDYGTGARDEVYFFNGLSCGGDHDRRSV
jgi:hypothetical protein